jgi:hypothetical protein
LLRSLQEIQPDFEEEAKAYAGLWSQGRGEKKEDLISPLFTNDHRNVYLRELRALRNKRWFAVNVLRNMREALISGRVKK